ncbi:hypothetical protein EYF80_053119 [Liparis tanakae]|uniref:Uncharacterized protein n=1 Tax=Liparis tanakae TaxID=230148 RepID=A0A4Z2F6I6_9TELE|nr:hypothetical protein EYF80_053119 [Liparis tanakae]
MSDVILGDRQQASGAHLDFTREAGQFKGELELGVGGPLSGSVQTAAPAGQTSGVWKEKKWVQVSVSVSMRTGSGGAEPMLGGLYKHM